MTINKIEQRQPAAIPQPQWTSQPPAYRWDELSAAFPPAPVEETYKEHLKVCGDCAESELLNRQYEIMDGLEAADGVDYNEGAPTAYLNTEGGLMDVKGWDQEMDEENQAAELESIQNHVRERAAAELTPGKKYDIWVSEEGYNWEPQDMDGEALECFSRNLCKLSADDVVPDSERALHEAHKIINAWNAAIDEEEDDPDAEQDNGVRMGSLLPYATYEDYLAAAERENSCPLSEYNFRTAKMDTVSEHATYEDYVAWAEASNNTKCECGHCEKIAPISKDLFDDLQARHTFEEMMKSIAITGEDHHAYMEWCKAKNVFQFDFERFNEWLAEQEELQHVNEMYPASQPWLEAEQALMDGLEAVDEVDYNEGAPTSYLKAEGGLMDVKGWDQDRVLQQIAKGDTRSWDTCTPEQAREALHTFWGCADIDAIARKALGWTERKQ